MGEPGMPFPQSLQGGPRDPCDTGTCERAQLPAGACALGASSSGAAPSLDSSAGRAVSPLQGCRQANATGRRWGDATLCGGEGWRLRELRHTTSAQEAPELHQLQGWVSLRPWEQPTYSLAESPGERPGPRPCPHPPGTRPAPAAPSTSALATQASENSPPPGLPSPVIVTLSPCAPPPPIPRPMVHFCHRPDRAPRTTGTLPHVSLTLYTCP